MWKIAIEVQETAEDIKCRSFQKHTNISALTCKIKGLGTQK